MKLPRPGERATRIIEVVLGLTLGAAIVALLPEVPAPNLVPVGFLLCALMGACLFVAWWGADNRADNHEQRLIVLERRATTPAPAADGRPEKESKPVEPLGRVWDDRQAGGGTKAEPDTVEIPVVAPEPPTEPMSEAWDKSAAALVANERLPALHVKSRAANERGAQDDPDNWREVNIGGTVRRFYVGA